MKNKPNFFLITGVSQTGGVGGGGPLLGNFSHIIPFFSDNIPNLDCSMLEDQEDQDLFWQDKVETGFGCLKVGNKLLVHKSLQIFNSSQQTMSSLIINDRAQILWQQCVRT